MLLAQALCSAWKILTAEGLVTEFAEVDSCVLAEGQKSGDVVFEHDCA